MKFDSLAYLNFLWGIPLLLGFYIYASRRRKQVISKFAEIETFKKLVPEVSAMKAIAKPGLILLAFALIVFSLTGPKWGFQWEEVKRRGIDIIIAVDVSRSMLSEDIKPNRLERAKREILDLFNMLQGDRVGLVAFAGVSFLECPLTLDYSAAALFLDTIDTDLIPIQGTNLGSAILKSMKAFDPKKKSSKAIILITDGEDHDKKALEAAKQAKNKGIKIYTIGVGAEGGAPIPVPGGGFKKSAGGSVIVSKLNEEILQKIAVETGAAYVRSVSGDMDLEKIYLKEIKETMEGTDLKSSKRKRWEERYQVFLFLAFMLLIFEFFLTTKKRAIRGFFRLSMLLSFMMAGNTHALNLNSDTIEAGDLFKKKKYKESLKLFSDRLVKKPDNPMLHFNTGHNYYKMKEYDKAIESYSMAAVKSKDQKMEEKAYFNIGNSYFHSGKLEDAALAYRKVLDLNPNHENAKKNLALTLKEIKKRMKDQKKTQKRCENKRKEQKNQKGQKKQKEGQKDEKKEEQTGNKQEKKKEQKQQQAGKGKEDKKGKDKEKKAQGYVPHKMSEEDAKKWLKSLDEKKNRKKHKMKMIPGGRYHNEKDW